MKYEDWPREYESGQIRQVLSKDDIRIKMVQPRVELG